MTTTPASNVDFGMQLPIQARSRLQCDPWEDDAGAQELALIAQACDTAGFSYVGVCDHVAVPRDQVERMQTAWYDTVATLGWLAALTTRVRLLSHVFIVAYRHPLVTAKSFMTLDHLSGGRAILGVGAGHAHGEFDVLGVPFEQRGALTDESIDVLRAAFDDEWPDIDTPHFAVHDVGQSPRPAQAHLPIWVGGSSAPALRRAATRGDGWLPQGPPAQGMAWAIDTLTAAREQAGRTGRFDIGGVAQPLYVGTPTWDVGDNAVAGDPEELAAAIGEWVLPGVTHLSVRFRCRSADELVDQIAAFGAEVIPLVRG
ncbi:MAG TPA: TIGR03619 family F420-dependent LLM class oxidoreductase [Acidimicrobiales bacterium]|jgi:probable F420-dependent oxidoreductase|nr:TIGR03619 family F420-dependent LLM class oxidoreductase [Acidimicrobiales bacterium]